ncbi:VOC family protein [Promicromonospora sp. NPDC059942]|uniref:VOC family protein n=1 Tax=Promicromonospora sp. NPDC059942 TaxID=3347009 RepID=UPI0036653C10
MSTPTPHAVPAAPAGSATADPFIWSDDASGLIRFLLDVFDATEVPEARTADTDGLVLHSEIQIGDSTITIADRKPQWPYTPAFVRVYVEDPAATLQRAVGAGARVVTEPTEFWGDVLARFADPFGHLWWVYKHNPANDAGGGAEEAGVDGDDDWTEPEGDEDWESFATPELTYVHTTLMEAMAALRDPRER